MKLSIFIISFFVAAFSQAQQRYIVSLKDKQGNQFQISNPSAFLSPRAIDRRTRYGIAIDSTDLPVSKKYLDSIQAAGDIKILNTSKWLNLVLIETTDATALQKISNFPFVNSTAAIARRFARSSKFEEPLYVEDEIRAFPRKQQRITANVLDYGTSFSQVHIHNGDYLHELGFRGENMIIVMLDAGYQGYLTNRAFDSIRKNNQIAGTWDFVKNEASVNEDNAHGMYCFSILAANLPGQMVGTAPAAKYYLFRTEDAGSEYPVEEQNWAAAAERADSIGADLITSSLGYTQFDKAEYNHTYQDLDGNTTLITRAADFAAKKGIIVTNSAGNEGASPWKYLSAPADGDSVLAVGAVNAAGQVAGFSGYGPSADGRVKPDIASVGWNTFFVTTLGTISQGNGTSFSNPNVAGLITCLWQAFPEFSNMEIIDAVKKSASQYGNPDDRIGYGIPDFKKAYEALTIEKNKRRQVAILKNAQIKVFPVPFTGQFTVLFKPAQSGTVYFELFDATGKKLTQISKTATAGEIMFIELTQLNGLPRGVYFLKYHEADQKGIVRIMK